MDKKINFEAIKSLNSKNTIGDIWGALAAMLVALPSAIAFGVTIYSPLGADFAAIGAIGGILGTAIIGMIAASMGGAKQLISAPCAPAAAVLSAFVITAMQTGYDPNLIVVMVTVVAVFAGVMQIGFGVVGLGKLIKFMPYTVVSGYLSGVGLYIITSQLPNFLGLPHSYHLVDAFHHFELWSIYSIVVGIATAIFMLLAPKVTTKIPAVIIGLLGGILTYFALAYFDSSLLQVTSNPLVVGLLSNGSIGESIIEHFKSFANINFQELTTLLIPALTLAVLLSIDTLKTCVVLDAMTRSQHNSNKELIAQGTANITSCMLGGVPGAGQMGATLINLSSGGNSKLSGVLEGLFALIAFAVLSSFIAWIPIASLAAILIIIGFKMIDLHSIELVKSKQTILDFLVILSVVITALTVSLIAASAVGIILSILLFIKGQIKTSVVYRRIRGGKIFSKQIRTTQELEILRTNGSQYVLYELQGSLFFGTANQLFAAMEDDIKTKKYIIIDMKRTQFIDFTAAHILQLIVTMLEEQGGHLIFTRLPIKLPNGQHVEQYFGDVGLLKSEAITKIFIDLDDALEWVENQIIKEFNLEKNFEKPLELEEFETLAGRKESTINDLKQHIKELSFKDKEYIFEASDESNDLYFIRKGVVKIVLPIKNGQTLNVSALGRGSFFGEFSFLDNIPRSANAIANGDVELYVLTREAFDNFTNTHKKSAILFLRGLIRALVWRLRNTNSQLSHLNEF